MLGPLKFGLQKPVPTVKATADPGRFALTLSLEGSTVDGLFLNGPAGSTAYVDWGDGTNTSIGLTGTRYSVIGHSCGSTATISGSNLIYLINVQQGSNKKIKGITGTYPTALKTLQIGFNYPNPVFTPPNVETLLFAGKTGPSSLTTGSNLISLDFPPNLTNLHLGPSTKLTTLPTLPVGLESLTTPPGLTVLPALPSTLTSLTNVSLKLTTINLSGCTGITNLRCSAFGSLQTLDISNCRLLTDITTTFTKGSDPTRYRVTPPSLTNLRIDGSGLTYLDLTGTNVSTLNIPPEMYPQLGYLKLSGSKVKLSGLLKYPVPSGANWILY